MDNYNGLQSTETRVQLKGLGTEIYSHRVDGAQFSQMAHGVFKVLYFPKEIPFCCVLKRKLPFK